MKNLPSIPTILGDALFEFAKAFINAWASLPSKIDYPIDNQYYYRQLFPMEPVIVVVSNRTPKASTKIKWFKLNEI